MTSFDRTSEFLQRVARTAHLYPPSFVGRRKRRESTVALREAARVVDECQTIPKEQRLRSVVTHLTDAERAARDGDEYMHVKIAGDLLRTRLARQVCKPTVHVVSRTPELRSIEKRLHTISNSFIQIAALISNQSNVIRRLEEGTLNNEYALERARDQLLEARLSPSGTPLRFKLLLIAAAFVLIVFLF